VLVPRARVLTGFIASGWGWWREPVAVIGTGVRAVVAIRNLQRTSHSGYRPVAVVSLEPGVSSGHVGEVAMVGGLDKVENLAREGVRVALLETDLVQDRGLLDRLQSVFRHVVLLRGYDDLPVEGLQIRNLGDLVGVEYTNNLLLTGNRVLKRALDVIVGGFALVLATPLVLCATLLVKIIDGGPVLFFQDRRGLNGRRIVVPKVRTMARGAEDRLDSYLSAHPDLREEWQRHFKLAQDPRLIPYVGRTLRRFSIDELPQLWSVVIGDMSLVGPRPFPDYHIAAFSPTFLDLRTRVRPGITGLWQVNVRSGGTIEQQQAYDSYYIRNWSVWLDLYVLCRTVMAVATGRGAY
jgi:lipopolysaccharide/colanic/teichoic acid biosynthesis glycosyltransferase